MPDTPVVMSPKQAHVLGAVGGEHALLLFEGAIRSGKTHIMPCAALGSWRLQPVEADYAIVGRTVGALERNVIPPLRQWCKLFRLPLTRNDKHGYLMIGGRRAWLIGANDKRAEERIQGMTAAGIMVDELALLPRAFVMMMLGRVSHAGAQVWATYNPATPGHWLKREIVDNLAKYRAARWHFTFEDNPVLPEERKALYRRQFTGHFYKRFVEGVWAAPSGLIYPNVTYGARPESEAVRKRAIGMDYGSAGVWACNAWDLAMNRKWYASAEMVLDFTDRPALTDPEMVERLVRFIGADRLRTTIVYADPSTPRSFKYKARAAGIKMVYPTADVLTGLRFVDSQLAVGDFVVDDKACPKLAGELITYSWDEDAVKRGEEKPIKEADHSCDAMRYFAMGAAWFPLNTISKPKGW